MDQFHLRMICFTVFVVGGLVGGVAIHYWTISKVFSMIDALYFSVVVIFTFGYGDIVPNTPTGKLCTAGYALYWQGYGVGEFEWAVSVCEKKLDSWCFTKADDEKTRDFVKLWVSVILVLVIVGMGLVGVALIEMLRWVDTYYFVSVSSSFVGYGDISFRSSLGKGFAIVWLSLCGVILGRAFTYIRMYLFRESVSPETRKNMETKWSPRFENRRIAVALSFIESQATLSWIIDNLPISSGDTIYLIHVASEDSYDNLYRDTGSGDVTLAEFRTTKGRLKYHVTADIESADLQRFGETMKPKKVSLNSISCISKHYIKVIMTWFLIFFFFNVVRYRSR